MLFRLIKFFWSIFYNGYWFYIYSLEECKAMPTNYLTVWPYSRGKQCSFYVNEGEPISALPSANLINNNLDNKTSHSTFLAENNEVKDSSALTDFNDDLNSSFSGEQGYFLVLGKHQIDVYRVKWWIVQMKRSGKFSVPYRNIMRRTLLLVLNLKIKH